MKFCRFNFKLQDKGLKAIVQLFLLSCFLIYSNTILSQQFPVISICDKQNSCTCNTPDSLKHFNEKLVYDSLIFIKDTALLACCYHQLGVNAYKNDNLITSIELYKEAIKLRTVFNDGLLWKSKLNIGINYHDLGEYKLATTYLLKAYSEKVVKSEVDSITILRNLGNCFAEIGEIEKGIEYLQMASKVNADSEEVNWVINDLSTLLIDTQDTISVKRAIQYSNNVYGSTPYFFSQVNALINLAYGYSFFKKYDKSIAYFKKALHLTNNDDLQLKKAIIQNNISTIYHEMNTFEKAITCSINAIAFLKEGYELEYDYDYYCFYENIAESYTAQEKLDTALFHYQKALINLTNNFRNENILQNPNPANEKLFIYSYPDIIRVLHLKATAALKYYQKNNNQQYLALANQTYQTAFNFHDKLQKDISTENSRLFQAKNIVPYIENALEVAYKQQENGQDVSEAAFRFMEKNKATVLLQSINEADALQYANLPDSLLEKESDLKVAISFHNKQLNDAIAYEDLLEIERLNNVLFEEDQQYTQLISNLEQNHPDYHQLKYKQNQTTLNSVQHYLNESTALIEYFVGDKNIYILCIQKDESRFYQYNKPNDWNSLINNFLSTLNAKELVKQDEYTTELYNTFIQSAAQIYQLLLKPVIDDLGTNTNISALQIIPDGQLNYIPFELLLTEKVDTVAVNYKTLPYLLKEKAISYAYSVALLLENRSLNGEKPPNTYAGFAPEYTANGDYEPLKAVWQNVQNVAKLLDGKPYIGDSATKENFFNNIAQFKSFQLAMHGILDDEEPLNSKLIFSNLNDTSNYELHAYELYNINIPAQLGVLSACETGKGLQAKGEGIMSLSRAFTYAGCNSLLMSLWSIEDKATAQIVDSFFKHIEKGKAKHIALQQAKLDYLKNKNTPSSKTHPIYWAGLVQSGNLQPIDFGSCHCWLYWLIFLLISFGAGLYLKQRENSQTLSS